uniref:Uncharacterized protein n=1 Tax=Biomphalaria glabrata TaxID=6526 RepID=A0A2C9LTV1_BIOGL
AGEKDDRYGYSQLKQKIRDLTLHLEFCDQGLIEATQEGLQMTTLEKLMDSLQVSSAPISIVTEAPISPVLLERYECTVRAIQKSFPGYPRRSIITKLEVLKALSGGTLNMFSNYHLIKAITNSIIQDRVQQNESVESKAEENESVGSEDEENESVGSEDEENESVGLKAEENESVGSEDDENE